MGGGGWLLTSFFSIIYILGLVCYKHTIHVHVTYVLNYMYMCISFLVFFFSHSFYAFSSSALCT